MDVSTNIPLPQKHPRLLYVLSLTEVWERFAYYLMVGLFVLYLTTNLNVSKAKASLIFGFFTALVYFCPLLGGWLADKWLGYRRSVLLGSVLMAIGYFGISVVSYQAMSLAGTAEWTLYTALAVVSVGNGFFKPNINAMVSNLYPAGDARRDTAFNIFYMGVNIGAALGPLIGGFVREEEAFSFFFKGGLFRGHWSYAFLAAAIGMILATINLLFFYKKLQTADVRSSVGAALQVSLPQHYQDPRESKEVERKKIISILIICFVGMFFWMAYHQNGTTLTFWAAEHTNLSLGGLVKGGINPERFQIINPVCIMILTPLIVGLHGYLRRRNKEISTPVKIMLGLSMLGLAYVVMVAAAVIGGHTLGPCTQCLFSDDHVLSVFFIGLHKGQGSALWLVLAYFVTTIGELYVSPMGLSLITKMAPARMTGLMVGCWFVATALGNIAVGETGELFWQKWPHHYFFAMLAAACVFAAAVVFVALPYIRQALPKEK